MTRTALLHAQTPGGDPAGGDPAGPALAGVARPPDWMERGKCWRHMRLFDLAGNLGDLDRQSDEPTIAEATATARRVCRWCPVRVECGEYAIERKEELGIWGGMTEQQRTRIRNERAAS